MKTLLALLLLVGSTALAQEPGPTPVLPPLLAVEIDGKTEPIQIARVETEVRILGAVAETATTMTFRNPHPRALEGDLYFPLPDGATVSGYALDIGGAMVDGVAVTKEKARRTFEKEVRKGIDPGIVEWTKGNCFRTRIFPLPARGSRTVTVRYVSEVIETEDGALYRLPLNFAEKVSEFALRVEVVKTAAAPEVGGSELANFSFAPFREGFRAETTMKDAVLTRDLLISLPPAEERPVLVERDEEGVVRFVVTERVAPPARERAPAPERLAVLWDASGSRGSGDRAREIEFLRRYLESVLETRPSIEVSLTVFRNEAEAPQETVLTSEGVEGFLSGLRGIAYDGGTRLSAISLPDQENRPDLALLFSDGISTFGRAEPGELSVPVFAIRFSPMADASFLRSLARRTGGGYVDLGRATIEDAVADVGRPVYSFLSAVADGAKIVETYPRLPEPASGRFLLAGVLRADEAEITLNFGYGEAAHSRTFTVRAKDAVEGDLLRRFWAQKKLADLLTDRKRNELAITRLGRRHGLVTPFTSLIVLESLEQYLEHEILPPKSLPAVREKYVETVESRRRRGIEEGRKKLERIVELWQQRVEWWETKFEYPEDFRYEEQAKKESMDEESGGVGGRAGGGAAPAPSADDAGAQGGGFGFGAEESEGSDESASGSEPGIALAGWNPKTPYLAALKAAPAGGRFAAYMRERGKFGNSPAFFLDCADFFMKKGDEGLGVQVLSNIAEMELEDASLLRILGHRLEQLGYFDLAILCFEDAKRLRPEEPQSWRDLGLVLAKRGGRDDLERAVDLLYHVVLNEWDRFEEIELLTLMELNQVIPKARAAGVEEIPVDPRLVKPLDLDIRIVMTWDADLTDMDLHVLEPSQEEAYYGHNRTTIGGLVSRDFTQGYGPEEYLLRKAMHGRYIIRTNFFGSSAAKLIGAVTLHVDVYTNYGRPNQKVRSMTLRLTEKKETFTVGEIEF